MLPDFISIRGLDILDILMVSLLIYQLYKIVRGTVAIKIFVGILSIYLLWKVVDALKMELLTEILGQFIGVGVIALIIVFQQELRRFLLIIGTTKFFKDSSAASRLLNWGKKEEEELDMESIIRACKSMAETNTGALIVLMKNPDVVIEQSGDAIDATLSTRLLENIFYKNSPMHDGAVIISDNRIVAARCVLPVTDNEDFPSHLGMRHRSAFGVTESSEAISIVVSEQTGEISAFRSGKFKLHMKADDLRAFLMQQTS